MGPKRSCCGLCQSVFPMFSSKSFIVSNSMFRSFIHFEFVFVWSVRECSNFIFLHVAVQFSSTTYWRDCVFSIVCSCLRCRRLGDHRCLRLFLGFLCCFIDLYFCFGHWLFLPIQSLSPKQQLLIVCRARSFPYIIFGVHVLLIQPPHFGVASDLRLPNKGFTFIPMATVQDG